MKYIHNIFKSKNHKDIMLVGLYISSITINLVLILIALVYDFYIDFFVKSTFVFITILLFRFYLESYKTKLFAILLMVLVEFDIALTLSSGEIISFSSIYPFMLYMIFGVLLCSFFFFFKLRNAFLATLVHYIFWGIVIFYGKSIYPSFDMIFTNESIIQMFVASLLILIYNIFYYFSTEVTYQKLQKSDAQKEILLKEIHHRIKNNLNMIASIMGLQILSLENGNQYDPKIILRDSKIRIEAMALVHEAIYKNNDLDKINFEKYINNLLKLINQTYKKNIDIELHSDIDYLPLDSMKNLGIIINELFTNSIKYAFNNEKLDNKISIYLVHRDNELFFVYSENRDDNVDIDRIKNSKNLGIKLINLTVKQMRGSLDITQNSGLIFTVRFKI